MQEKVQQQHDNQDASSRHAPSGDAFSDTIARLCYSSIIALHAVPSGFNRFGNLRWDVTSRSVPSLVMMICEHCR